MKYFTDQQLEEMSRKIKSEYSNEDRNIYLAYLRRITELNEQCAKGIDRHKEIAQAISEMQLFAERHILHKGNADVNDEDADAYEYENYDFDPCSDES